MSLPPEPYVAGRIYPLPPRPRSFDCSVQAAERRARLKRRDDAEHTETEPHSLPEAPIEIFGNRLRHEQALANARTEAYARGLQAGLQLRDRLDATVRALAILTGLLLGALGTWAWLHLAAG